MKLLIVESNGLFRDAFVRRFRNEDDIDMVGEIDHLDPVELPAEVQVLEPDIVLLGVGVADTDTLAAVNRVMAGERHPGVVLHGHSLTLPAAMRVADILRSVQHGFAYLDSDRIDSVGGLVAIARVVADGKVVIDPMTTQRLLGLINMNVQAMASLTAEERLMLGMMARGETDDAIAEALGIDRALVSAKVVDVAAKFGVEGTTRDARVTTILRYLVGTGALPMDYDTGAVVRTATRSIRPMEPPPPPPPSRDEGAFELTDGDETEDESPVARVEEVQPEPPTSGDIGIDEPERPQEDPTEVISPAQVGVEQTYEPPVAAQPPAEPDEDASPPSAQETVDEFAAFSQLGKPDDVEVALRVLEWAAGRGLRVRWGARSSGGSFALVLDVGNHSFWLLTVWAIGTVEVQFAMMMAQPPFSNVDLRRDLANRLNLVQGVRVDEKALGGRPRVPLASLRDQEDWELFTGAMDWAIDEVRSFFQPSQDQQGSDTNRQ